MLEIRTTSKETPNTSSVEMVYGAPLTVLGDFLPNTKSDPDVKRYLAQLRDSVGQLRLVPMSIHGTPRSSVPNDLCTANFVLIRHDTRRKPLRWGHPRQITPTLDKEQSPKNRVTTRMGRTIKTPSRFQ
uniref:Uncharacterized protein n=1 Tax=Octopus bimaculoides TaxID=37653 RepID=A0A0L8FUI7_OCTBM